MTHRTKLTWHSAILSFLKRHELTLLISGLVGAFFIYAFIHHQKHLQFLTFGWDLSVFDQPVWLFSQGKSPYSSLMSMNTLGDHFHPLVLLIGGWLYKIWADPRMLLWYQSLTAIISAGVLYFLSQLVLKKQTVSLALTLMYIFSVSFQSMILDDFHDDVMVTLPLILTYLFIQKKNWFGYWLAILWILLTKEEFGLLVSAIGACLIIFQKAYKQGIATILIGLTVFFLLLEVIMPLYSPSRRYAHYSATNSPVQIIPIIIRRPFQVFTTMVDHPNKRFTLATSLLSFGGLPLLSPPLILPMLETLIIRFIDPTAPLRFAFNNHYNGPLVALLAIASIYGASQVLKILSPLKLTGLILAITLLQNLLLHGPVNSIFKPSFYEIQSWQQDAHLLIAQVPRAGLLATQNSLLPHLSQRDNFCLLPKTCAADYIAVDLADGPNKFYGQTAEELTSQIQNLVSSGQYEITWQRNLSLLLKKIDKIGL